MEEMLEDQEAVVVGLSWWQLHENSKFIVLWNHVIALAMFVGVFIGPIMLVYLVLYEEWIVVCWLVDAACVSDIVLNFVIVRDSLDTRDPRVIAWNYFSKSFCLDLLVTMPTVILFEPRNLQFIRLFRLFWRQDNLWNPLDHALSVCVKSSYKRQGYSFIIRMFVNILIMCHFYVCCWLYLGDKYLLNDKNDPWLVANEGDFGEYSISQIYIFAFYWIMETISTVGYGDYSGGTRAEYLFSLTVEFSGMTLCSVLMFSVSQMFTEDFNFESYIEANY
jgi:hypothetical protein